MEQLGCLVPYQVKNLPMSSIGGCLLLSGNTHIYPVTVSTMPKYEVCPSILLIIILLDGLSPPLLTTYV